MVNTHSQREFKKSALICFIITQMVLLFVSIIVTWLFGWSLVKLNAMTKECYPQIKTTIIPIISEVTPTIYNVSNI